MCKQNDNWQEELSFPSVRFEGEWITSFSPKHTEQWNRYCSTCCYLYTYPIHNIIYEDPAAIIIWDLISDWEFQFAQIIMRDWNQSHIP